MINKYDSPLERKFHELCEIEGLELEPQVNISGRTVDFLIKDTKVIVEIDGFDSHSFKTMTQQDYTKDKILKSKGYSVLRFRGDEIKYQIRKCIDRVKEYLSNGSFEKYSSNWVGTNKQLYMAKVYSKDLIGRIEKEFEIKV